jgi:hypothetical protein
VYFFDGHSKYYQIQIVPKDHYKIPFVMEWGAFVWIVMHFGIKNGPPKY